MTTSKGNTPTEELERLRAIEVYRTETPSVRGRYGPWSPAHEFNKRKRKEALGAVVGDYFGGSLAGVKWLDVGCSTGALADELATYGMSPSTFYGIDLMEDRITRGRELHPEARLVAGSAHELPFESGYFDVVSQFNMLTSVRDDATRVAMTREMERVVRPGGLVVSYDFFLNPTNPETRPLRKQDLLALFPGCTLDARKITLAPPLARALERVAPGSFDLLYGISFLRTHYLAVLTKSFAS